MNKIDIKKISKSEFLKLNEDDIMFITNPGRMGDEDGSTFIVREKDKFTIYRIDGWMYPLKNESEEYKISMGETAKQFPKWYETWEHESDENYKGKYKYLYMGFGNGLSIDNSIYKKYKPYLDKAVEKNLEKYNTEEEKEEMKYAAIFNVWEDAFLDMLNNENKER